MPKLIDYPRTTYSGAWELAEVTDDTGGKCAIETAARKLNRKVSGSFKAIIGSAVKFGLITSKRDLLTTTTLFKRIKHAYDKQEELLFHREAFLTPPLFTQLCRKFRSRELPIQMLDVMLIREFGVEEINAQGVAKAFVEGCRMVGLLDERNIIADIDALAQKQSPRRELASPQPTPNSFRNEVPEIMAGKTTIAGHEENSSLFETGIQARSEPESFQTQAPIIHAETTPIRPVRQASAPVVNPTNADAIANLFGLSGQQPNPQILEAPQAQTNPQAQHISFSQEQDRPHQPNSIVAPQLPSIINGSNAGYQIQVSGPGINTSLSITEEEDISLAVALLEKIRRQLKA